MCHHSGNLLIYFIKTSIAGDAHREIAKAFNIFRNTSSQ